MSDNKKHSSASEKNREINRRVEKERQYRVGRFLDCILALAAISQLALLCFAKLGQGAHHHLGEIAEEISDIQEKAQKLQERLENAARSMGHAPYVHEMGQRRLLLWQEIKKLFRKMGGHG